MLAAVILACPLLRVEARLTADGLIDDETDLIAFCSERINQLLDD